MASTKQLTIFGTEEKTETDRQEVEEILRKFPASASNPGLFNWLLLSRRHEWLRSLPENKQNELRQTLRDAESIRRRRQEVAAQMRQEEIDAKI